MITGVRCLPCKYAAGEVLDSTVRANIAGQQFLTQLSVGAKIVIPEIMDKIYVTDRLGEITIERAFLKFDRRPQAKLIPIFSKVCEASQSAVLIHRLGVEEALAYCDLPGRISFLTVNIWDSIVEDLRRAHGATIDCFIKDIHDPGDNWGAILNNDYSVLNSQGEYPWGSCKYRTDLVCARVVPASDPESQYFNNDVLDLPEEDTDTYVIDTVVPMDPDDYRFDGCSGAGQICCDEINAITEPVYGEKYANISYDTLTKICTKEREVESRLVTSGIIRNRYYLGAFTSLPKDVIVPTAFSSEMLEFCTWIHNTNVVEVSFRYILPNRERSAGFEIHYAVTHGWDAKIKTNFWKWDLFNIFRKWEGVKEVTVVKNSFDECLLEVVKNGEIVKYYFDLVITTLLSQNLTRTVKKDVIYDEC